MPTGRAENKTKLDTGSFILLLLLQKKKLVWVPNMAYQQYDCKLIVLVFARFINIVTDFVAQSWPLLISWFFFYIDWLLAQWYVFALFFFFKLISFISALKICVYTEPKPKQWLNKPKLIICLSKWLAMTHRVLVFFYTFFPPPPLSLSFSFLCPPFFFCGFSLIKLTFGYELISFSFFYKIWSVILLCFC